ncbi:hypothetical protein QTP88_008730 [Uroleucon formosanum]
MDKNKTLQFIESYKAAKLLWDSNHPDYCNKMKRNDALESIANEFNIDISAVKIFPASSDGTLESENSGTASLNLVFCFTISVSIIFNKEKKFVLDIRVKFPNRKSPSNCKSLIIPKFRVDRKKHAFKTFNNRMRLSNDEKQLEKQVESTVENENALIKKPLIGLIINY